MERNLNRPLASHFQGLPVLGFPFVVPSMHILGEIGVFPALIHAKFTAVPGIPSENFINGIASPDVRRVGQCAMRNRVA